MNPLEVPLMYRWNTIAAEQRTLRPDGLLKGTPLRQAIRCIVVLGCRFGSAASFMRMPENAIKRSIGRAARRGLLDWELVQRLNDDQLERAAYTRMPRTSKKSASEAQEIMRKHWEYIMGQQPCDS
jgi:hypothetical protein